MRALYQQMSGYILQLSNIVLSGEMTDILGNALQLDALATDIGGDHSDTLSEVAGAFNLHQNVRELDQ